MAVAYDSAVVISSPAVPCEVIRAAGLRPTPVLGSSAATPAADAQTEPEVFPSRLRQLMEAALTGQLRTAACVVLPRTSDVDYKAFLYLREFVRRGVAPDLPPIILYDLLQSRGSGVRDYDVGRTHALCAALAAISGRMVSADGLRGEIQRANAARQAARRLLSLRCTAPRVTGSEVLPLLAAFWQMDPEAFVSTATAAAHDMSMRPPLSGVRVLLTGAPVDTPVLHQAIETHGTVVCAEPGPFGSDVAGADVRVDGDPVAALADKYRSDVIGARTPIDLITRWTGQRLDQADAVVVSLPSDDAVFGWDYPALRDRLDQLGMPHVCLRVDPYASVPSSEHARLGALAAVASRLKETGRG